MSQNTIYTKPALALTLFTVLLALISCGTKKHTPQDNVLAETNPKLIFLNYTISKNSKGENQIEFINKIVTDGKLKTGTNNYLKHGNIGDLKCSQLDKNAEVIQSIIIKNPFYKTIEFVNDSLIFEKRKVELNSSPLSFRLQLSNRTKLIVISEMIDSLQNSRTLIKTKLD